MASEALKPADHVGDSKSCRAWLNALTPAKRDRVVAIVALLERLSCEDIVTQDYFECLELVRVELLGAIDDLARALCVAPIPFTPEQRPVLRLVLGALHTLRDGFKQVYARKHEAAGGDIRSVIPGATHDLHVALPLARALDAQSRAIALLLRCRTLVAAPEWDELCLCAQRMRRTTFLDEILHDRVPLTQPNTARGAFAYPILLLLAGCESFVGAERNLIDKLSRRMAVRVGFAFEARETATSASRGLILALGSGSHLRIHAEKVLQSLAKRRLEWLSDERRSGRAALGLDAVGLAKLLDHLAQAWGQGERIGTPETPSRTLLRVRFGLPAVWDPHSHAGQEEALRWIGDDTPAYHSGSQQSESVLRMALGSMSVGRNAVEALMAEAQTERLHRASAGQIVFDRQSSTPPVTLGDVVAMLAVESPPSVAAPAAAATDLVLGRVASVQQFMDTVAANLPTHRVGVQILSGSPAPVGVRMGEEQRFSDAYLLRAMDRGQLDILVMRPGVVPEGTQIVVREATVDIRVLAHRRVGSGPGYQLITISGPI